MSEFFANSEFIGDHNEARITNALQLLSVANNL